MGHSVVPYHVGGETALISDPVASDPESQQDLVVQETLGGRCDPGREDMLGAQGAQGGNRRTTTACCLGLVLS